MLIYKKNLIEGLSKLDSESVYNNLFLKTKIKSHGNEVTDFYTKEIPKVDSNYTC